MSRTFECLGRMALGVEQCQTGRTDLFSGRRVVILLENLPYPQDRRVRLEAEALERAGAEVIVLAPAANGQSLREMVSRIDVRRFRRGREGEGLGGYIREYVGAFLQFGRMLAAVRREKHIDVLHACTPPDVFFPLAWICRLGGTKFVFDHHDPSPELFLDKGGSRWNPVYWALRLAEWLSYRSAAAVIASSKPIADLAMQRGGVRGDRVFLVRSGIRPITGDETRKWTPSRTDGPFLVAYLGVMSAHDGLDSLVEAARIIRRDLNRSDINWLLIGDGPERGALEARVSALRLQDHFRFTGFVSGERELASLLQCADVCVTPDPATPFNDCCLMAKVLDYLAAGRAQVAFPLRETKEVAGSAVLFAQGNSASALASGIVELIDDVNLRRRLESEARARANRHGWVANERLMLAAYLRALGQEHR